MLRVFDYVCADGHLTEHFSKDAPETIECFCGKPAHKQLAAPQAKLEGITGAFPGAYDKWERVRREKQAVEQRIVREHGPQKW